MLSVRSAFGQAAGRNLIILSLGGKKAEMKILHQRVPFLLGLSLVCFFAVTAPAATITGTLGFFGPGVLTFSTGGGAPGTNFIDWCPVNAGPAPAANCGVDDSGQGLTLVSSTSGSFTAVDPFLSQGTILDMTDQPGDPGPYTTVTLAPTSIPGFLNFADPWLYTLTQIQPQTCTPSADRLCTGYFKLVQVGSSVSVNMAGLGFITAGGDDTPFQMLITGNFANTTIAQVVAAATSPAGIFSASWSGELTAVPEPGTIVMGLLGLALVGSARVLQGRRKA
jgi:hypothetical protein